MDPSLIVATDWVRVVLLGSIATTAAFLAIATIGLLMLRGRTPVRRGVTAIIGCFVLFSAATIADGLVAAATQDGAPPQLAASTPAPAYTPTVPKLQPYDPYAGASVPTEPSGQASDFLIR